MIYQNATAQPRQELTDVIMEGITSDDQFIGLQLLPPSPLSLPQGHVPKITIAKGDLMRASSKVRTPGAKFDRWQSAVEDHSMTLLQVSEEVQIPDEQTLVYEDYFAFESIYAKEAANRLQRGFELDVEAAIFSGSNFDSNNSAVAYTAANIATMTPVADIIAAIRLVKGRGERPNTLAMSGQVYDRVRVTADMKSFIAGSVNPGAIVTPDTITSAFSSMGIKKVLIGEAYVNQSPSTANTNINAIWPNTSIFVGNVASGALTSGGVGRTFFWEKEGALMNVSSYRDEPVKSNVIRAMKTSLSDITNTRAGTLITTQYS